MAEWPSVLPAPVVTGYGITPNDPVIRTSFEQGVSRSRNRFTKAPTIVRVSWLMSREQFAIFEAWHRHKIANGAEAFTIGLLTANGWHEYQATFSRMWDAAPAGKACVMWNVSAELELDDRVVMDEVTLDFALTGTVPSGWVDENGGLWVDESGNTWSE